MAKKIMIVDDDPIILKYLTNLYEDNGYEICIAEDGVTAMDVLKEERPDLISLDLEMPNEWGSRFYRKLRKDKELKDTPIIVVSGLDGDHAIKTAVAFVKKPFDPDKLIKIVKDAIG